MSSHSSTPNPPPSFFWFFPDRMVICYCNHLFIIVMMFIPIGSDCIVILPALSSVGVSTIHSIHYLEWCKKSHSLVELLVGPTNFTYDLRKVVLSLILTRGLFVHTHMVTILSDIFYHHWCAFLTWSSSSSLLRAVSPQVVQVWDKL